jgi:hypothetical protein
MRIGRHVDGADAGGLRNRRRQEDDACMSTAPWACASSGCPVRDFIAETGFPVPALDANLSHAQKMSLLT